MRLPDDTFIAPEKIFRYLLVPQFRGDKSAFLAKAGYNLTNATLLLDDLRSQVLPCEAVPMEITQHGQYFEIRATLTGPNGVALRVRSIWMKEQLSQRTKFVTLVPDKRPS